MGPRASQDLRSPSLIMAPGQQLHLYDYRQVFRQKKQFQTKNNLQSLTSQKLPATSWISLAAQWLRTSHQKAKKKTEKIGTNDKSVI